jgi:hypothetical protein
MGALDDALLLLDTKRVLYETLPHSSRRLINQAIFLALTVRDPDTIDAQRTPLYDAVARALRSLEEAENPPQATANRSRESQNQALYPEKDPDAHSWGRGSYKNKMAGATGVGPGLCTSRDRNPAVETPSAARSSKTQPPVPRKR